MRLAQQMRAADHTGQLLIADRRGKATHSGVAERWLHKKRESTGSERGYRGEAGVSLLAMP
jgi:hypothetical protein